VRSRLAPWAGLDLDIAAQPQLAKAGDRLFKGRHARRQVGPQGLGDQAVDAGGALQRVIVHGDRHAVGGQLDVDFDPGSAAFPGFAEEAKVFSGA